MLRIKGSGDEFMLLYGYYAVILVILFVGVKFVGIKEWNNQFMSLKESKAIQAICAILIIFHHMSQKLEYCKEIQIFLDAGILFVAIFMFCSGYGLIKSLEQKDNYLDHFLKKRLVTVLVPFYLINTIYVIYSAFNHEFSAFAGGALVKEVLLRLIGIKLANGNEWFMVVIAFLYIFFYVFFKHFKQFTAFVLMAIVILAYICAGLWRDHNTCEWWLQGEWWYNTVFLFYVGLLFGKFEKQIIGCFKKVYYVLLPVMIVISVIAFRFSVKVLYDKSYYGEYNPTLSRWEVILNRGMCLGTQILAMVLFVAVVLLIMMKLHFDNPVLRFIGKISLEIYLIHDLFLMFYHSEHCNLVNDTSYVSAILVSTIISAFILWFISSKISGVILKKKK